MDKRLLKKFLEIKKASLEMLALSGCNIDHEKDILEYDTRDMQGYMDFLENNPGANIVTQTLSNKNIYSDRSMMSSIYRHNDNPNHYTLVYFVPTLIEETKSVSKVMISPVVDICVKNSFSNQEYCKGCENKLEKIKQCHECPTQKYCDGCVQDISCDNCVGGMCSECVSKIEKHNRYNLSIKRCKDCPKGDMCRNCIRTRKHVECKQCPSHMIDAGEDYDNEGEKYRRYDPCVPCMNEMKCENCDEDEFCNLCSAKSKIEKCDNCPTKQFCMKCAVKHGVKRCDSCPQAPEVIMRCVIISETEPSPKAKQAATANIPKIKASTGEWLENGCVMQMFLDSEILIKPLIHSMGSRYQVLTTQEAVDLFTSPTNAIKEDQIYQLDMFRPISKYLGLYPGKVVRVERDILIPGTMLTKELIYRRVTLIPFLAKKRNRKAVNKNVQVAPGKGLDDV